VVWVIEKLSASRQLAAKTMAMLAFQFKPGMPVLALSCSPFLAIVMDAQTKNQNQQMAAKRP
jgi:hypothetical protein